MRESRLVAFASAAQVASVSFAIGAGRFSSGELVLFLSRNGALTIPSFAGRDWRNASPIVKNRTLTDNFGSNLRFVHGLVSGSAGAMEEVDFV